MSDYSIAEKLASLRTAKGVTQEDVAQSLSVSNKTISKWEKGTSMPDLPMLAELSKYYGVTTDSILGLSDGEEKSTKEEVRALFCGLDRKDSVLKAFETVRAIVPAIFGTVSKYDDDVNDGEEVFPKNTSRYYRSHISLHEFFEFSASSENVNIAVMMLRNKANFSWLKDPGTQKEITRLFRFLSSEDALSVLYFIHSTECSENFTADYIARNTGVSEERVGELLNEFCAVGECNRVTAHLVEGEVKVYECFGDGILLSLISLAFERMCGRRAYEFNYSGRCKMIGGK